MVPPPLFWEGANCFSLACVLRLHHVPGPEPKMSQSISNLSPSNLLIPSSFLSFFLGKYINLAFWILKQQESLFACITQHVNMCYSFVAMTGKWTCILILLSISATKVTHLLLYGFNT